MAKKISEERLAEVLKELDLMNKKKTVLSVSFQEVNNSVLVLPECY